MDTVPYYLKITVLVVSHNFSINCRSLLGSTSTVCHCIYSILSTKPINLNVVALPLQWLSAMSSAHPHEYIYQPHSQQVYS